MDLLRFHPAAQRLWSDDEEGRAAGLERGAQLEHVEEPQVVVGVHVRDPYDRELQHVHLRGVATCEGHKGV